MSTIGIAIVGAAGYGGQELLRLVATHPVFRVVHAGSRTHGGREVSEVLPQLQGFYRGLRFAGVETGIPAEAAAVVLAAPHGAARTLWPEIVAGRPDLRVVDLSADFRLKDRAAFDAYYGGAHPSLDAALDFVYGVPETNREAIRRARHVANPGCFATGAVLALAPLAEAGALRGDVCIAATTGSSGSGAEPKEGTHHPERAQDMRAYKVLAHQHLPEIEQELRRISGGGLFELSMVPQSGPFSRGIFTVAQLRVPDGVDAPALFRARYAREPFVRLRAETPALRHVVRTNFCDVAVVQKGTKVAVLSALDNLVKGMSGQALQNLNLMFELEETAGLLVPGANP